MAASAIRPSFGRETEGELHLVLRMPIEKLDGPLTHQPGEGDSVLLGQRRQLPVFAIVQIDGHTVSCRHWVTSRSDCPRCALQPAAVCCTAALTVKEDVSSKV